MTENLSMIDLFSISLYLLLMIALGIFSARGKNKPETFLIADRKLGFLSQTATIVASKTGAGVLVTFVALVYIYGLGAMWFFIGASIGYIIFSFFAAGLRKRSSEKKFYTLSDYFALP
jgi:Na+/proline symporter